MRTPAAREESSPGSGITLQDLTPQAMRRLGVPADTRRGGGGASRAACRPGTSSSESTASLSGARRSRLRSDGLPPRAAGRHARVPPAADSGRFPPAGPKRACFHASVDALAASPRPAQAAFLTAREERSKLATVRRSVAALAPATAPAGRADPIRFRDPISAQ